MTQIVARAKDAFARARERWPWLDHLVRAKGHYDDVRGDRLAASVTYFAFLSFFPLLALAFAVLGYAVAFAPDVRQQVSDVIADNLPGLVGDGPNQINLDDIAGARTAAGIVGLLGLLVAGLGWVNALRDALRAVWRLGPPQGNVVVKKLSDLAVLLLFGLAVLLSVVVSSVATSATQIVLGLFDLEGSTVATLLLRTLAVALAVLANVAVFLVVLTRLPGMSVPRGPLLRGALLGAVGLEVLKLLGTTLVRGTLSNPVYGTFAIVVGLLVWIDFIARYVLFASAWTYTAYAGPTPAGDLPPVVAVPATAVGRRGRRRWGPRLLLGGMAAGGYLGFVLGRGRRAGPRPRR